MKDAKKFRLSFYQAVVDDPDELQPCDDPTCDAGLPYQTIDYFADVAEAEYELALEELAVEIGSLHAEIRQRDNQIKLLSEKLEEALSGRALQDREGNPNSRVQRDEGNSQSLPFCKDGSGRLVQNRLPQSTSQNHPDKSGDPRVQVDWEKRLELEIRGEGC